MSRMGSYVGGVSAGSKSSDGFAADMNTTVSLSDPARSTSISAVVALLKKRKTGKYREDSQRSS
jgi:hypothetical protein